MKGFSQASAEPVPGAVASRRGRPLSVVIVDDHPVVRRGLAHVIGDEADMVVSGESDTVEGALNVIRTQRPDVVILDLALGTADGLEVVKALRESRSAVRVLVLSMRDEMLYAERALAAGALGYVMKQEPVQHLLKAIRWVASGKTFVSERVSQRILASHVGRKGSSELSPIERLSDRERQVLELIGRGLGPKEMAEQLHVSVRTIDSHRAHIKDKLALKSGRELLRLAVTWVESL